MQMIFCANDLHLTIGFVIFVGCVVWLASLNAPID